MELFLNTKPEVIEKIYSEYLQGYTTEEIFALNNQDVSFEEIDYYIDYCNLLFV
jgi:hypothetical protein